MIFWKEFMLVHKSAIALIAIALCKDFWIAYSNYVYFPNPPFKPQWPHEMISVTPSLPNQTLMDLSDFQYLSNPAACNSYEEPLVLTLVVSKPENYERRRFIRDTWGKEFYHWRTIFLMGRSTPQVEIALTKEKRVQRDIVQGNFVDTYRNLTYKHVMGLRWASEQCVGARYVLKIDDDVVVDGLKLSFWLARSLGPWGSRGLMACQALVDAPVMRTFRSKWRVSPKEFPDKTFPPYCAGWAVIYDGSVARRLGQEAQQMPYFWIDDVLVTGLAAARAGIVPADLGPLETRHQRHTPSLVLPRAPPTFALFSSPDLELEELKYYWNYFQNMNHKIMSSDLRNT